MHTHTHTHTHTQSPSHKHEQRSTDHKPILEMEISIEKSRIEVTSESVASKLASTGLTTPKSFQEVIDTGVADYRIGQEAALERMPRFSSKPEYLSQTGSFFDSEAAADLILLSRHPRLSDTGSVMNPVPTSLAAGDHYRESICLTHRENEFSQLLSKKAIIDHSYRDFLAHRVAFMGRELVENTKVLRREALVVSAMDNLATNPVLRKKPMTGGSSLGIDFNRHATQLLEWSALVDAHTLYLPSRRQQITGFPWSTDLSSYDNNHRPQQSESPRELISRSNLTSPQSNSLIRKGSSIESKESNVFLPATSFVTNDGTYTDVSPMPDPTEKQLMNLRSRGSQMESFPVKLYRMLVEVDDHELVAFFAHGRSFKIFDGHRFSSKVMQRYFHQTRLESFKRQLNVYGFKRICEGPEAGGYYHEYFLRGRPLLANLVRREPKSDGLYARRFASSRVKYPPNFGAMSPICLAMVTSNNGVAKDNISANEQSKYITETGSEDMNTDHW